MHWQIWQSPKHNGLPEDVRNALVSQFHLEAQAVAKLGMVKRSGQFAGRPVRFIQIFEPSLVNNGAATQLKYEQVEKGEYRKSLLFEGRIEKSGEIYLSDRRPKQAPLQPV